MPRHTACWRLHCFSQASWDGVRPGSDREFAATLAERAVELDESDPWAHLGLAFLAFSGRQTDEAVRHFHSALGLNPNFPAAAGFMAFALAFDGQSEEAIRWFEQALRMSPRDPFTGFFYGGLSAAHYMAGRYREAVVWARKAVQLRPGILGAHRCLCASLAQAGQIEEAKAAMRSLRRLQSDLSLTWIKQSVPYTAEPMERFLDGMRKAGLTE
jgi:adenylate cyclase